MGPGKKKKKTATNNIRGFATTSLPSKSNSVQDLGSVDANDGASAPEKPADSIGSEVEGTHLQSIKTTEPEISKASIQGIPDMSPEMFEEYLRNSEAQTLIDEHGSWCEAEAQKQIVRLENQRRVLRSQAQKLNVYYWLPNHLVHQILGVAKNAETELQVDVQGAASVSNDPGKLLLNLWLLHQVFDLLHFAKIYEVIEYICKISTTQNIFKSQDYIWGLQECLEWFAQNLDTSDIIQYDGEFDSAPKKNKQTFEHSNLNDHSDTDKSMSHEVLVDESSIHQSELANSTSASESSDENDPEDLQRKYIELKTRLFQEENSSENARTGKQLIEFRRKKKLGEKLKKIEQDILFDRDTAEQVWKPILNDLQIECAQTSKSSTLKKHNRTLESWDRENPSRIDLGSLLGENLKTDPNLSNSSEVEEADVFGGLFNSENSNGLSGPGDVVESEVVRHIEFGTWSGTSPRAVLEEQSMMRDSKRQLKFQSLHKTQYSVRVRLELKWSVESTPSQIALKSLPSEVDLDFKPQKWILEMKRVSTSNFKQSEAYCSTLLLFLLNTISSGKQKFEKRLPTIWRNLLKEMTDNQKFLTNEQNMLTLRHLQELIDRTHSQNEKDQAHLQISMPLRQGATFQNRKPHPRTNASSNFSLEDVVREWASRSSRPAFQKMLQFRQQLPVHLFREEILKTVQHNPVTIICAETGAGKSSGIPVMFLEQNFTQGRDVRIMVTQPRRISAITLARRVSEELGEDKIDIGTNRSLVGYAIRSESKTCSTTRITYATTGVLLRMLEDMPELDDLDYIVLDEVHERTMDLDLLFIALKTLQTRRRGEIKLILMSATVDAKKFSAYFGDAPVLNLPGRTFPVDVRFLEDALEATNDVLSYDNPANHAEEEALSEPEMDKEERSIVESHLEGYSTKTRSILTNIDEYRIDYSLITTLAIAIATKEDYKQYSSAILIFLPGIGEITRLHKSFLSLEIFDHGWVFHLLHSSFSTEDLEKAFSAPPAGHRKIIITTNIAETGITIPDVTAVIDTCKEKIMRFDERRQTSKLIEGFISRSSARQRRGRAARVRSGLCFHLVTKYRHDNLMLEQQVPEMLRLGLQEPILRIKMWQLGSVEDILSAAIDPPSLKTVNRAVEKLKDAGALTKSEELTPLGHRIARIPSELNLAKSAILGVFFKCLDPILTIVSLLGSKSIFNSSVSENTPDNSKTLFFRADSDLITCLNAYQGWKKAKIFGQSHDFCRKNKLSEQILLQIEQQKIQLLVYIVDAGLIRLSSTEKAALNKARATNAKHENFYSVPVRYNNPKVSDSILLSVIAMAFYPKIVVREGRVWRNVYTNQQVSLVKGSVNGRNINSKPPKWLSFYEAMQTKSGNLNISEASAVPESALAILIGDAEFHWFSGVIVIDNGRVRLSVKEWKEMAALKIIRERIQAILSNWYKDLDQSITPTQEKWIKIWNDIMAHPTARSNVTGATTPSHIEMPDEPK